MDKHTIQVLEYGKALALVARYASTEVGRERILSLRPFTDIDEIKLRLKMTSEMRSLHEWGRSVPLAGVSDVREAISKAKTPGALLDAKTILLIGSLARAARALQAFFKQNRDDVPQVWNLARRLVAHDDLEADIDRAIDEDTNICDGASAKLKKIRQDKARVSSRISSALSGILAKDEIQSHLRESLVTIRNGRYVIPVRAKAKTKISGIVHDTSQSGATVFIEPIGTVELNNTLRSLELEEKDEIVRILAGLTEGIGRCASDLILNLEIIIELDTLDTAARFAIEFGCKEPTINQEGRTLLMGARHPILVETRRSRGGGATVPLDVKLGGDIRGLLITGPNAGCKTVALKTIGLLTLLVKTGLPIPCADGTEIALFDRVYADIGDEQSIELSLSTFSSHMSNIIAIMENAGPGVLVLLDEIGAGTDPFEGSALARTVIEELLARGATLVATTHHMSLKVFAHETASLENASMEFDSESLSPTYRLIQGIPGASHAFEIASRLGMADDLLERAHRYCGDERVRFEELTRDLLEKMRKLAVEEADIEAKRRRVDEAVAEYESRLADLKKRDREMRKQALKEAKSVVDDAKRRVTRLVKDLKEKQPPPEEARLIERTIRQESGRLREALDEIETQERGARPLETVVVGARAYVRPLSREGVILSDPDDRGRLEVAVGAMRVEVAVTDLFEPAGVPPARPAGSVAYEAKEVPSEIEVRGMTAEDAWEAVDKYLDDASLCGYPSVRIIHGKGRGILAKRIREMLVSHPRVSSHRFGDLAEGGTGVTVVELEKG